MKPIALMTVLCFSMILFAGCASRQELPYVYSTEQPKAVEKQKQDETDCKAFAEKKSGYDPAKSTALDALSGGMIGTVLGVVAGWLVGGDPATGAKAGALIGGIGGGAHGFAKSWSGYRMAYLNCMSEKGYIE